MRLAMFNENPGTCILMRKGVSTVARTEAPLCFSLFLAGAALWNELAKSVCVFWRGSAAHEKLSRWAAPSTSPTEIRCWNIHKMPVFPLPPEEKEKAEDFQFSKQCRLCVWFKFFISVILCSQREFHAVGREREGRDSLWPAPCKRKVWVELIFSWELQLMSGSSELLASIGGIWRGKLGRSCWLFLSECEFTQGCLEFKHVYLIWNYAQRRVHKGFVYTHTYQGCVLQGW